MEEAKDFIPFWEHVSVLRSILVRMLFVILFGVAVSFYFHETILKILTRPLVYTSVIKDNSDQPEKIETYRFSNTSIDKKKFTPKESMEVLSVSGDVRSLEDGSYELSTGGALTYAHTQSKPIPQLIILSPLEGMFVALKSSFWVGLVGTSPLWLWMGCQFILPALTRQEKSLILPFFLVSSCLILTGFAFTFYITIPLANGYLAAFNSEIGINLWSFSNYLDYTLFLLLANGLAFELAAIGLMAVHLGLVGADWLSRKRRVAIVLAFVIGALLTPPDILTQLMLAVPLIVLYEAIILYARLCRKRHVQYNQTA